MPDDVMHFLVANGGGTIDELLVRVPSKPQEIAESLQSLADQGYLRVSRPESIGDLGSVLKDLSEQDSFSTQDRNVQTGLVLKEIAEKKQQLMSTFVNPTIRGAAFSK